MNSGVDDARNGVEASEHRPVEKLWMVRGSYKETVGLVLLQELQERVEDPPDLTDVIAPRPFPTEGVDLVEEVDAVGFLESVEDEAELCRRLAHELGDEPIELDQEKGKVKVSGEGTRRHRLARPWRADEEQAPQWLEPLAPQTVPLALLQDHPVEPLPNVGLQDQVRHPGVRVGDGEQSGQLSPRLSHRNGATWSRLRLLADRVDEVTHSSWANLPWPPRDARAATCIATE